LAPGVRRAETAGADPPIRMGRLPAPAGRNVRVISIRRVSLGGGFRYLMESVAAGDRTRPAHGLAAYYAQSGTPPGRFVGAGLADVDNARGVEPGSVVSEEHLQRMLGMLCDPVSGQPVGSLPMLSVKRVPVAGFDLTFSGLPELIGLLQDLGLERLGPQFCPFKDKGCGMDEGCEDVPVIIGRWQSSQRKKPDWPSACCQGEDTSLSR
jgi:hypothetical protein